jgi:hypothetical protein
VVGEEAVVTVVVLDNLGRLDNLDSLGRPDSLDSLGRPDKPVRLEETVRMVRIYA